MNASDAINYLNKAIVCSAEFLKFWAVKFILFNVESILETKQWIEFVQKNSEFISEIDKNGNVNRNTIPGKQIQFSSVGLSYVAGVAIDYINSAIAKVNIPDIEGEYQEKCQLIIKLKLRKGLFITFVDASVGISPLNANFGVFVIKFHRSLLDDIIELFRKEIEKHFKEKIEIICQVIERVESDQGVLYIMKDQNDPKIPKPNNVIHPYNTNKYLCIIPNRYSRWF
uniref:Uncharacterized protein n=1 Tax=Strongyloides venezuelensis TaxID=75913 RepID=A0A0K0FRD0_STRVS